MFIDNKMKATGGMKMLSTSEKETILKAIFSLTDNMDEAEKNYMLGYIKGFEDKSNLHKKENVN